MELALELTLLMWVEKVSLESIVTPRYLAESVSVSEVEWIMDIVVKRGGCFLLGNSKGLAFGWVKLHLVSFFPELEGV